MGAERTKQLLNQLIDIPQTVIVGTVKAVNVAALTCEVEPDDGGAPLLNVGLRAVLDESDDGLAVVPVEGSAVVVLLLDAERAVVALTSQVQGYSIRTAGVSLRTVLLGLVSAVKALKVTTPNGPSGVPINQPALTDVENQLKALFVS